MSLAVCLPHLFEIRDIDEISKYMMTQERWDFIGNTNRSSTNDELNITSTVNIEEPISEAETSDTIQDKFEKYTLNAKGAIDGLFWSMFIAHYGMNEYKRVGLNNGNEEMKEKKRIT